jgi:ubiquinone/menaquinone biosynthesis C-methylase UbiE
MIEEKEIYWSRFANDFDKRNEYVAGKSEMEKMKNRLKKEEQLGNVLELGCGSGVFSKVIACNSRQLLATDLSDEMVNAARNNLQGFENVHIQKASCFDLPFETNTFDTVFMANLLHVIPNPEKALAESKRVLKSGGCLLVLSFTMQRMTFFNRLGMMYRYLKTYGKPPKTAQTLRLEKACFLLKNTGFEVDCAELSGNKTKAIFVKAYG